MVYKTEERVKKFHEQVAAYIKVGNLWDPEEEEKMVKEAERALAPPEESYDDN